MMILTKMNFEDSPVKMRTESLSSQKICLLKCKIHDDNLQLFH